MGPLCHLTLLGYHPFPLRDSSSLPLYSVCRSCCNQLYSLPIVLPRWLVDLLYPEIPFSTLSVFLCSSGLFLSGGWQLLAGFFLSSLFFFLHLLTYLLPTVIPSHILPSEQASLSLHLAELSFTIVSAFIPLPAYLASPRWASHSVLVLVSSLQVHLSGSSY